MATDKLPLILKSLVERAFVCDPVQTEHDLEWLDINYRSGLSALLLELKIDRSRKCIVCIEDCEDMTTLDAINRRLAERIRIRALREAEKAAAAQPTLTEVPVLVNAEISASPKIATTVSEEALAESVDDVITRALDGKTIGIKLLEDERNQLRALMAKHGVRTLKEAVIICIQKGLAVWQEEEEEVSHV